MPTPIVVGAAHDKRKGFLLNAYARERLQKELCPTMNASTLLVLEGRYRRTIFGTAHKSYNTHRRLAEKELGVKLSMSPLITWRDARLFPVHRAALNALIAGYQQKELAKVLQPGLTATSLDEVLRRVEAGLPPHVSPKSLSRAQHVLLWNNAREVREFDKCVTAAAMKHRDTNQVIVVCGAVHALAITRAQGWALRLFVTDTPESADYLIRAYHLCYILPQCYTRPVR